MIRTWRICALAMLWLVLPIVLAACSESSGNRGNHAPAGDAGSTDATALLRIVSLSPAISRALVDFELTSRIVGRTPHCASLPTSITIVGDLLNINYEHLVRLRPTHILVQPPSSGIDPHLMALAQERGWSVGQWRLNTIVDVETMVREIPQVLYEDDDPQRIAAEARASELIENLRDALRPEEQPYTGRVLMVSSVDPVMAFGHGTYMHDILTSLGGLNAVQASGWVQLSFEDVVKLNPDALIVVRPGHDLGSDPSAGLGPIMDLDIAAVMERRFSVLQHPDAFLPSTSLAEVARELQGAIRAFGGAGE